MYYWYTPIIQAIPYIGFFLAVVPQKLKCWKRLLIWLGGMALYVYLMVVLK